MPSLTNPAGPCRAAAEDTGPGTEGADGCALSWGSCDQEPPSQAIAIGDPTPEGPLSRLEEP